MRSILSLLTLLCSLGSAFPQLVQFELRTRSDRLGMDGPTATGFESGSLATGGLIPGGSITFNQNNNTLTIAGLAFGSGHGFVDLQGSFASAHIHNASGLPSVTLSIDTDTGNDHSGIIVGGSDSYVLNSGLASDLLANQTYINVHSSSYADGEIRGNLVSLTPIPEPREYAFVAAIGLLGFAGYRRYRSGTNALSPAI